MKLLLPCNIAFHGPHHDNGDEAHKENDHHKGVEDGKPVNLLRSEKAGESIAYLMLKEVVLKILLESILEGAVGSLPVHLRLDQSEQSTFICELHFRQAI